MLTKTQFRPGILNEVSTLTASGQWYDCDKVRFRKGLPERIGGWVSYNLISPYVGVCRALINWLDLSGNDYVGVGTNIKMYIENGQGLYDITPIRATLVGTGVLTTASGTNVINANVTSHGAVLGDYVTISGVTATVGGLVAATFNNINFQVTQVVDSNNFKFTVGSNASSTATGGGGPVSFAFEITVGLPYAVAGLGWGAGFWGHDTWGASATSGIAAAMRLWSLDNFGQNLFACVRDGGIYMWQTNLGLAVRAVTLTSVAASGESAPTIASVVAVTPEQYVVAFGCTPLDSSTQDPLFIRWSAASDYTIWRPTVTNAAGGIRLGMGSRIVTATKMRRETLVFTDAAAYSMQFTGPPYTYSFTPIITNCTIASQNAVAVAGNVAFWMGNNKFYMYNGQVQTLVCDVKRKVFGDINVSQIQQVCAGTNEAFNEIWWFYPSTNATVNDRYVVYNYVENIWYYGALSRTAWVDSKLRGYPIAAYTADSVNGRLIYQEFGLDDLTTSSSTAIAAYVESAEFDITDGEHVMFIQRAIPDVMYNNSTAPAPTGTLTVSTRNFPGNSTYQSNANNVVQTVATPVPVYTNDIWIRLRGRQAKFRFESNALGVMWQLGTPRLDVKPDGKR